MPDLRRARGLALTASAALLLPAAGASSVHAAEPPPGRGYELVSPLDTNNADVVNSPAGDFGQATLFASEDGERVMYGAYAAFAGAPSVGTTGFALYAADRGAAAWTTTSLQPPLLAAPIPSNGGGGPVDVTPDLRWTVISTNQPLEEGVPVPNPSGRNLYLRDQDGELTPLGTQPGPGGLGNQRYGGMSADGRRIVFESPYALAGATTAQVGAGQVYKWIAGELALASVLPDGSFGTYATNPNWEPVGRYRRPSVSTDGRRVAFIATRDPYATAPQRSAARFEIYVRVNGTVTKQASASQRDPGDPGAAMAQMPTWGGLSADGRTVWFSTAGELTDDAATGGASEDLYAYDVASGELTDVSVATGGAGAGVRGVAAISDDGSTAYFVGTRVVGGEGVDGSPNLYVARRTATGFETRLVATLDTGDGHVWSSELNQGMTARVTPDGQRLVFVSRRSLTGYDNRHATTDVALNEVFRFDYAASPARALTCVSCNPSGARPIGRSGVQAYNRIVPTNPTSRLPRNVTDDGGRVFFNSADKLLAQATNGANNVYMWEDGELTLLNPGDGPEAWFADASRDGDDAFLTTAGKLVDYGQSSRVALWAVRVGGGFPPPGDGDGECEGDGCQGPPTQPPVVDVPASFTYVGDGNVDPGPEPRPPVRSVTVKVSPLAAAAQRRLAAGKRVPLTVRVSGGGRIAVTGTTRLPGARTTTRVISAARTTDGAATVKIPLRLSAAARRALAQGRALAVRLDVTHPRASGAQRTTLRLTGARRAAKKRSVNSSTRNR